MHARIAVITGRGEIPDNSYHFQYQTKGNPRSAKVGPPFRPPPPPHPTLNIYMHADRDMPWQTNLFPCSRKSFQNVALKKKKKL